MSGPKKQERMVPASYTIPEDLKGQVEREAVKQDLSASHLVRRIFRDFFQKRKSPDLDTSRK